MQQTIKVLIADRLGFVDVTGRGVEAEVKEYIEERGGYFHYGSVSNAADLGPGIHFFYLPDLDGDGIADEAKPGRYDMINLAATPVPASADFPKGGVRWGAGTNNFPEQLWQDRGIPLMNVPAGNSVRTALTWLDALIATAVDLDIRQIQQRLLNDPGFTTVPDINDYPTLGLEGKRIAILGISGNIGHEVKNIARALRMQVVGWAGRISGVATFTREDAAELGIDWAATIEDAARGADILTLHFPYKPGETDAVIGAAVFEALNHGAVLINFARGELVDIAALEAALSSGQLSKIAVDADIVRDARGQVADTAPLQGYLRLQPRFPDRMLLLPHIATDSDHYTRVGLARRGVDQVFALCQAQTVYNSVQQKIPPGYRDGGIRKPPLGKLFPEEIAATLSHSRRDIETLAATAQQLLEKDFALPEAVAFQRVLNRLAQLPTAGRVIRGCCKLE